MIEITARAPAVSKSPIFAGTVRLERNHVMKRCPPPRRSSRPFGSIVVHDESSTLASPPFGWTSYAVFHAGPALGIAGTSTIFASMFFHCPPKTAMPSTVVRSTTREGGSTGATTGNTGATGGGACAPAATTIPDTNPSARQLALNIAPPLCGFLRLVAGDRKSVV